MVKKQSSDLEKKKSSSIKPHSVQRLMVIGSGNMGSSLIRGLAKSWPELKVIAVDQHGAKVNELSASLSHLKTFDSIAAGADEFFSALQSEAGTSCIILCVKPQDLDGVAETLRKPLQKVGAGKVMVMSILAGVAMEEVSAALAFKGPVVRAMPNIAAMVGEAATAMTANEACAPHHLEFAERVFGAVGLAAWTKESLMDAVTGLSGSGPAYVYIVIEALTDGGVKMGLPRELAARLATQTVLGSAVLVQKTQLHPAVLRDQVTTPGGTTINAIHELESHGIRAMLISAVAIATERSRFLRESSLRSKK